MSQSLLGPTHHTHVLMAVLAASVHAYGIKMGVDMTGGVRGGTCWCSLSSPLQQS